MQICVYGPFSCGIAENAEMTNDNTTRRAICGTPMTVAAQPLPAGHGVYHFTLRIASTDNCDEVRIPGRDKLRCESCPTRDCLNLRCASPVTSLGGSIYVTEDKFRYPGSLRKGLALGCWCIKKNAPFILWFPRGCVYLQQDAFTHKCPYCGLATFLRCIREIDNPVLNLATGRMDEGVLPHYLAIYICSKCAELIVVTNSDECDLGTCTVLSLVVSRRTLR